jgi:hypothetical protein
MLAAVHGTANADMRTLQRAMPGMQAYAAGALRHAWVRCREEAPTVRRAMLSRHGVCPGTLVRRVLEASTLGDLSDFVAGVAITANEGRQR